MSFKTEENSKLSTFALAATHCDEAVKELNRLYNEKTADNKEKWSQLQHITVSLSQYHLIASDTELYIP